MEFDQLRGFFYAARYGSFTAAARHLYLTQPAISLQVRALEREIGERLFDRVGRKVRLTCAGEALFHQAEDLVERFEEIRRVASEFQRLERGRLSLGASDTTSMHVLPGLLQRYVELHPEVELAISSSFSSSVARRVHGRDVDLGIVTLPIEDQPRLEVVPLFCQRVLCAVPRAHPLAGERTVPLAALRGERLVLLECGSSSRRRIDAILEEHGVHPRAAIELSNFEIIKRYVAVGLGISLVPSTALEPAPDGVAAVPTEPAISLRTAVIYRGDRRLSHAASAFLEMALEHFGVPAAERAEALGRTAGGPGRS